MAASSTKQTKKRRTASRKNARSKASSRQKPKQTAGGSGSIREEIAVCLIFAVSILMVIGNLGIGGRFGNGFADILFGIFGLTEYAFPFTLLRGAAFYIANRTIGLIDRKMIGLGILFVFTSAFLELLIQGYTRGTPAVSFYRISSSDHTGGGIVGGLLVTAFAFAFGTIGAYVLIIAGLIIGAIVLTQRPIIRSISQKSTRAAQVAREKHQVRRELREIEREKLEEERARDLEEVRESYREELSAREENRKRDGKRGLRLPKLPVVDIRLGDEDGEEPLVKRTAFAPTLPKETGETNIEAEKTTEAAHDPSDLSQLHIDGVFAEEANEEAVPVDKGAFHMPSFLNKKSKTETETLPEELPFEEMSRTVAATDGAAELMRAERGEAAASNDEASQRSTKRSERPAKASREEQMKEISNIELEIHDQKVPEKVYEFPSLELLTRGKEEKTDSRQSLMDTAAKLQQVLQDFGVNVHVVNVSRGPTVTRYELQPEQGVKVSRIVNLQDDIKLNLAASEIRIEAPIPGKAAVGIEVPNKEPSVVNLREMFETPEFQKSKATIPFAVGKDIGGRPVIADIEKMPHLLIAGATGSGKSVCINTLIMSILYKASPDDVKMLMIDPKVVEMKIYDGIPHLLIPVVTDAKKAAGALNWAVQEMTDRYNKFASHPGIRDIKGYNKFVLEHNKALPEGEGLLEKMPRIVVIVDELADLMMVASGEVEDAICRLAQLARAAGIHLIIATQRPSVNVVTGLIKANMPSRIALSVTSGVDSRTIIDMNGAEKLLGHGDMLFYPQNYPKPARVQGDFVSDDDITRVVEFLTAGSGEVMYNKEVEEKIANTVSGTVASPGGAAAEDSDRDEYFADAGRLIIDKEKASIGMLQRAFKIGFNRAARIMDQLSEAGVVGSEEGTKPRKILVTQEEFEQILSNL